MKIFSRHFEWIVRELYLRRWLNNPVLWDVIMFIRRTVELNFIDFQVIQIEEVNGLLLLNVKIGNPMNIATWICSQHFVSGKKSNNPLAPNSQIKVGCIWFSGGGSTTL